LDCVSGKIQSEFEKRRRIFASEGFGFQYDLIEYNSMIIFMENHGEPIKITEEIVINRHDGLEDKILILEYNDFIVSFYEWMTERVEWNNPPRTTMLSIRSKENIEYLYGIKHGMTKEEVNNIIGITEITDIGFIWVDGNRGNVAWIYIQNNKIENIVWFYALE
jgi:hypothetical protein